MDLPSRCSSTVAMSNPEPLLTSKKVSGKSWSRHG